MEQEIQTDLEKAFLNSLEASIDYESEFENNSITFAGFFIFINAFDNKEPWTRDQDTIKYILLFIEYCDTNNLFQDLATEYWKKLNDIVIKN